MTRRRGQPAACGKCGMRYPLWFWKRGAEWRLGERCAIPGCTGRIGVPTHLTHELDALRGMWELRRRSIQTQAAIAGRRHQAILAAFLRGFGDALECARLEVETTLHGQVVELAPVPVFPFPDAKTDARATELLDVAREVAAEIECFEPHPERDGCGKCAACRLDKQLGLW